MALPFAADAATGDNLRVQSVSEGWSPCRLERATSWFVAGETRQLGQLGPLPSGFPGLSHRSKPPRATEAIAVCLPLS